MTIDARLVTDEFQCEWSGQGIDCDYNYNFGFYTTKLTVNNIYLNKIITWILFQTDYFDSKDLQGLPLQIDPKFSTQVEINKSSSVVHIPTDVYKGGE